VRNAFGGVGEKVRGTWSFTTRSEKMRYRLRGVILGCGLAAGENLIKAAQMLRRQAQLHGRQSTVQLVTGSRTDDRCGDRGPGEQPGEAQRARLHSDLLCQVLVRLDLVPMLRESLRRPTSSRRTPVFSFLITPPSRPPCNGDQAMQPAQARVERPADV
jgi:hypothetical protein